MIKKYVQEGKIYFPAIEFIAKVKLAFLFVFFLGLLSKSSEISALNLQESRIDITGTVVDSESVPLPGVNILVKGTSKGVTTDFDGNFSIEDVPEDAVLVFGFLGFDTQEVPVNSRTIINVVMEAAIGALDEVMIVGYGGTVKRSDVTGSVSQVEVEQLKDIPGGSVESLLQGRVAGLQITTSSQAPGAGASVRIRGGSSLRGSNSPLLVVDGFPIGDAGNLQQINPADIESIEILKDASASAIYGSRGANGVILVTTRNPKNGKTVINVRQQTTVSQFTSELNLWRNPVLLAQLSNESRINGGFPPLYIGEVASTGLYYPSVQELQNGDWPHNVRWDDIVFRDTPINNSTTIDVSSSNEKTNFSFSGNYFTEQGVYIEDDYSKFNYNLNVDHKLYDNFRITFSSIGSKGKRNNNGGLAYWRSPIIPVYDENGDYYLTNNNDFNHPIALTENRVNKNKTIDFLSFLGLEWDIIPSLKLTSRLNYKFGNSISDQYFPKTYTEAGEFNNGVASIGNYQAETIISETFANYNKTFGVHKLGVTAGFSYQNDVIRTSNLGASDFVNEVLQNENLGAGNPERNTVGNNLIETELVSGIFRVNYEFREKYLFTFTSRADGSSKFGENNKWAIFPSGAIGWKAGEENFIKELEIFDLLKFRASYGISGNQGISPYQTLSRYGVSEYYNNGNWVTVIGPGYEVGRTGQGGIEVLWGGIPNPDLKWETTAQVDFGVDMGFFNDRLQVIFDYYEKHTDDLLQERILPISSGFDRMWVNEGSIANKGIELTLDGTLIQSNDFTLGATAIFYRNRNEVTGLGSTTESGNLIDPNTGMEFRFSGNSLAMFRAFPNLLAVGQPVNVFYGYKTDGIVQNLEEGVSAGLEGDLAQPGEFKYVDVNGDGVISVDDRTIIGDPNPDFTASFNLSLNYKKFDASIFFNGVFGNDVLNTQSFNQPSNQPLRWTPDNPTNSFPSLRDGRQVEFSDWWIEDGSFVRIQNLNLGYSFEIDSLVSARVFVNATNLYTFTKFDGYDPEVGGDGIYWGGYPRLRQGTIGLTLTF